ncbi:MAG TPA: hypothetical protein VK686_01095 [Bryobacteraceae bacterium]|nr:hypothetical protein [Bryobacteraceae bacterium]
MKALVTAFIFLFGVGTFSCISIAWAAEDFAVHAWQMESKGDAAEARDYLQRASQTGGVDAKLAYAQFLDRHRDPAAREAYEKVWSAARGEQRELAARRMVVLDLIAGDRDAAQRHIDQYKSAGGRDFNLAAVPVGPPAKVQTIAIPGPLRSFSRMAALAPETNPDDVLPALARNVVTNGYQAAGSNDVLEQTEYLKLVIRYLSQARELEKLTDSSGVIKIETCDSTQTGELLRVLGYRMRGGCGSEVVLETLNATRAFLTIDSGFPLAELEQNLRTNRPFAYDFKPTQIPILYTQDYWLSTKDRQGAEFIDSLLGDPSLCRLYLALSKLDPTASEELRKGTTVQKIRAYAHVLDFYGGMFQVRNGKAVVPGGARSEKAWADLVGASPDKPGPFFERLIVRDDGWLASYFDALARISNNPANGPVQNYLTEPERVKRFYSAIRGKVTSPGPARPVFRSNTDMMLLTARLRLDPNGKPHIPGSLDVWRTLFVEHPSGSGKYDAKLSKDAANWKDPDDVIEALFGLCRKAAENEPLKIFMALSDLDRHRQTPLDAKTADRLAREFRSFGAQYPIFAEASDVSNGTINQFLDTATAVDQIHDFGLRSDAAGTLQSLVGLWQIFSRQGSIAPANQDRTLAAILTRFAKVKNEGDVFDGGRQGVQTLLSATSSPTDASPQDRMLDLLAGTSQPDTSDTHNQLVEDMIRIFEAQRLISLSSIFDLVDQLESVAKGEKANNALITKTAARISEIQLPRTSLSGAERSALSFGYWPEKHIEAERKLTLRAFIDRSGSDPKKLDDIRGLMAPFLRDTLIGLNYVHYAPPGAQVLYANPLFVRSHDFVGAQGTNSTWKDTEVMGGGWPSSAGGRLVGSLVSLPYALADGEQNFLIPSREQALIWGDLVPQLLLTATIPRWWNVTPGQLHWVALHMDYAETMLAEAALNADRRQIVLDALSQYAMPARVAHLRELLEQGRVSAALDTVMPSELFAIARDVVSAEKADAPLAIEIRREAAETPQLLNYESISRAFGTPKPTLANSYSPELLSLRTFPTLMGYSSRILAESWESNLLFYAALADQLYLSPAELNVLVPDWTRQTVERIFATNLEDWPALLRSLRLVGDDVREKSRKHVTASSGF